MLFWRVYPDMALGFCRFNGGGHVNHSLFWKNLAPTSSDETKLKSGSPLECVLWFHPPTT